MLVLEYSNVPSSISDIFFLCLQYKIVSTAINPKIETPTTTPTMRPVLLLFEPGSLFDTVGMKSEC
jgi:hypothetical protein